MAQDLSRSGPALPALQGTSSMVAASSPDGLAASAVLLGDSRDDRVGRTPPDPLPLDHPGASYQPPARDPGWSPDGFGYCRHPGGGWDAQPYPQLTRYANEDGGSGG